MINKILTSNVTTYSTPARLTDINPTNYRFGNNRTGNSTISRIIEKTEA